MITAQKIKLGLNLMVGCSMNRAQQPPLYIPHKYRGIGASATKWNGASCKDHKVYMRCTDSDHYCCNQLRCTYNSTKIPSPDFSEIITGFRKFDNNSIYGNAA